MMCCSVPSNPVQSSPAMNYQKTKTSQALAGTHNTTAAGSRSSRILPIGR